MQKLVIEIDLDHINGDVGALCKYLSSMVDGMGNYPHKDIRTPYDGRPFAGRLTNGQTLIGSMDIETGPLRNNSFENIPKGGMRTKVNLGGEE